MTNVDASLELSRPSKECAGYCSIFGPAFKPFLERVEDPDRMEMPLRLLLVLHDFLPQALAGTELYVQRIARTLAAHGDVALFYSIRAPLTLPEQDGRLRCETYDQVRVYQVVVNTPWPPLARTQHDPQVEACFQEVLTRHRPHLVHFHHFAFLPLSLAELCRKAHIPYGITLHDYHLACPSGGQLAAHPAGHLCAAPVPERCATCYSAFQTRTGLVGGLIRTGLQRLPQTSPTAPHAPDAPPGRSLLDSRTLLQLRATLGPWDPALPPPRDLPGILRRQAQARQVLASAAWVISPSRDLAGRFQSWGWKVSRQVILPNPGPSWREQTPLPPPHPLRLLYLGTLAPHKGLDRIVTAIRSLPKGSVQLAVYGNPHVAPAYVADLLYSDTERIQFYGVCPPEDVPRALAAAHALVLGARWPENAPLTVLEAFAAGRPVIAPRLGGLPELIVHQQNGLLFEPNADPHAHAELSQLLHTLVTHPAELERLAAGTKPPPTLEAHAAELLALYEASTRSGGVRPAPPGPPSLSDTPQAPAPSVEPPAPQRPKQEPAVGSLLGFDHFRIQYIQAYGQQYTQTDLYPTQAPTVSVLIPTLNGGTLLLDVLDALFGQKTPWPFEILLLDSGSSDGSIQQVQRLSCPASIRLRCLHIPPAAFGHGRTRTWMAALAQTPLLVYLVQDATPTAADWLARLVETFLRSGCIAGYARQCARPDADPALRARIEAHTPAGTGFVKSSLAPGEKWEQISPRERLRRCALDNVCSIYWRQALLQTPFPDVAFAEELAWGMTQLRRGEALAYLPEAAVWHSHRRSFWHDLQRSRTEHGILRQLLGLRTLESPAAALHGVLGSVRGLPELGGVGALRQLAELLGQAWSALEAGD